jgi:hypothetical protein
MGRPGQDILDKFTASYPKDGMFWDDAIDLARKLPGKVSI